MKGGDGIWKFKELNMTPLIVANYSARCGNSSIMPLLTKVLNFLDVSENLGGDRGSWIGLLVRLRLREWRICR